MVQFRWIENSGNIGQLMKIPTLWKFFSPLKWILKKRMVDNGIGKHTPTEIYQMTEDDLHTLSNILGSKKYFGGDEPCEDDCAIFGGVAQCVWGMPGSSFERLVNGTDKHSFIQHSRHFLFSIMLCMFFSLANWLILKYSLFRWIKQLEAVLWQNETALLAGLGKLSG